MGYSSVQEHLETDIVSRANTYALLAKSSLARADVSKAWSSFQALVVLSLCQVLERKSVATDTIDEIARHITESRVGTRLRLRRSAVWINGFITELIKRGWNIGRATELFFISAL